MAMPMATIERDDALVTIKTVARLIKILFYYQLIVGSRHDPNDNSIKSKNFFRIHDR